VFVTLNIMDAYLTKMALSVGAVEANPLMISTGSSMIAKGLIAAALVFILYWFEKERALRPLNFMLFGVVVWNLAVFWLQISIRLDLAIIGASF
jgi:hypothetical protein